MDTRNESVDALVAAQRSAQALGRQTVGTTVAIVLFSLASSAALLIFGFGSGMGRIVSGTVFVLASVVALVVVASTAKARSHDFTRRYLTTIALWGGTYTFFVVVGFVIFTPAPAWFWIVGAVLVALPGIWFAFGSRTETGLL